VLPQNDPHLVEKVAGFFSGDQKEIRQFFLERANLSRATKKLVSLVGTEYGHDVLDLLEYAGLRGLPFQKDLFLPLLPRLYSIASAERAVGEEVHLMVKEVRYHLDGREYQGVASTFLCSHAAIGLTLVPIYLHKTTHFVLPPQPETPLIMVGPGTGIAPFRAFMQHKASENHPLDRAWLFFGEQYRASDFFYEDFWTSLSERGLKLDLAFSRDGAEKVYVQHKMWEKRQELWQWLEQGAHLYLCGSLNTMARDVEKMLAEIIASEGNHSLETARKYLLDLHAAKRYAKDVY
jgi:sulfite reductase (NADPH) flavoprotein alpha-component